MSNAKPNKPTTNAAQPKADAPPAETPEAAASGADDSAPEGTQLDLRQVAKALDASVTVHKLDDDGKPVRRDGVNVTIDRKITAADILAVNPNYETGILTVVTIDGRKHTLGA